MPSQVSSKPFAAHVLADFTAELQCELTVRSGDFVLVLPDPAPQGWCRVRLGRSDGAPSEGLVPWYYIVSAAHAELEAATAHLAASALAEDDDDLSTDAPARPAGGGVATAPPGQASGGEYLEVVAMRGQLGLGLDLDNTNVVRRISPGSMAAQQGLVLIGDSILEVDGIHLNGGVARGGKSVPMAMTPGQPSYRFKLYRPPNHSVDAMALQKDIMSTQRLQAIADGLTLPRGVNAHMAYVSHSGRQVSADRRDRARVASKASTRPAHVDQLRAWSIAELQDTLRRQAVKTGASKQGDAKALAGYGPPGAAAPPSDDDDEDLFGMIDAVVKTQHSPAAKPEADESGLKAIAGQRDEANTAEVEKAVQATLSGGTVPAWVFADYVERSRRPPAAVETAQLARPKPPSGSRPKSQLKPRGKVYTGGEDRDASSAAQALDAPLAAPTPAPAPSPTISREASAATTPAPPALSPTLSREASSAAKKSGGWFGSRKPKTPVLDEPAPAVPAAKPYSLVPEGGSAPALKPKWEPPPAAAGAPTAFRLVTGARQSETQRGSGGRDSETAERNLPEGTRAAPPPPDYIATMRMEDMLLAAAEAAAAGSAPVGDTVGGLSGAEAEHFRVALARYQEHPGIQRKQALGERAAKARREELNRPAYFAERCLLPERLGLSDCTTVAQLAKIGASAHTAAEVLAKPALRLLRASRVQIEVAKAATLAPLVIDERLTERQARACAYALPESAFDSSSSEGAAREAWRTANLKRYEAMEATHFASNASESILATPQPPQRSASGFSDSSEDDSPASAPVPSTRGGTPLGAPIPPNPASTGFKINLGAVKRDPVDNIKPLAVPHTPKADVVARLDARLGEVEGKGAIGDGGTLMSTVEIASTFRVSGAGLAEVSPSWASPSSSASPAAATKARLQQGAAYKALAARAPSDSQWGVVELGEKLGQGTYGSVYRAITQGVGGQTPKGADGLAAKLLKLDAKNAVAVAREVEILKQADHPNIVGYYDYFLRLGPDGGEPVLWLLLEYCALGSVLDVMEGQGAAMTEAQSALVLREVLTALHYMHTDLRALHRDVKAANVLLTKAGKVKLGDLGVAAQVYNTMQKRGTMIGTPHWMAPEAFGSVTAIDASTYDTKVDMWGVGITAIELATMKPPNSDLSTVFDIILAIVNGPPPTLPPYKEAPALAAFIGAALVKDPAARPDAATLLKHPFVASADDGALAPIVKRGVPAIAPL